MVKTGLDQMFQNARAYNMEGSEIVADVGRMELQAPPALVHLRGHRLQSPRQPCAACGRRGGGRSARRVGRAWGAARVEARGRTVSISPDGIPLFFAAAFLEDMDRAVRVLRSQMCASCPCRFWSPSGPWNRSLSPDM